jgi:hypothetical protein
VFVAESHDVINGERAARPQNPRGFGKKFRLVGQIHADMDQRGEVELVVGVSLDK